MAGLGGVWPRSSLPSVRNGSVRHKRAQISGGTLCQAEVSAGLEPFGFGDASSRSTAQWNWVLPIRHAQPQTPRGTRHELTGDFAAPCPGQFEREQPCRPDGATQCACGKRWPCPHHCQSPSLGHQPFTCAAWPPTPGAQSRGRALQKTLVSTRLPEALGSSPGLL